MPTLFTDTVFATIPLLGQMQQQVAPGPRMAWAPVVLLLVIAIGFTVGNLALSLIIGPSRSGPGKETTYESGMVPVGDTRQRFNVRFYIVAMIFLVFDVEIVFMYPWATIFAPASQAGVVGGLDWGGFLLAEMFIFVGILLLAYVYAWGKGVFRWD
jgi:NADH-quinone oxidoreductase subunit A